MSIEEGAAKFARVTQPYCTSAPTVTHASCTRTASLQVSIEEGDAKARELNVMFIETSAKAGCVASQVLRAGVHLASPAASLMKMLRGN